MAWPQSQEYREAIQAPQLCFHDPELRQGQPVTDRLGLPRPCAGTFADVYQVACPASGNDWAVKCFTREVPGLCDRYREISAHLQHVKLPFTVDFQYLDQGIRIQGRWYPILKMAWVEGLTLNEFIRKTLDKPQTLEALGQLWLRMAQKLRDARLAHADLQHGNVLLVSGNKPGAVSLKLIDYDGMFVPALAQNKSSEVGHPAYQHQERLRQGTYNAEVDRFSHLVIYTALYGLANRPALWDLYDNGDNLLFREEDFKAPANSPLFQELWDQGRSEVRSLVGNLLLATQGPLERVPLLADVHANGQVHRLSVAQEKQLQALLTAGVKTVRSVPKIDNDLVLNERPGSSVNSVCFSPDGKRLATAGSERTVIVRDARTGQKTLTLKGHTSSVNSVAFSPDGQRLASGSSDGTVILWDSQTGQQVLTLKGRIGIAFKGRISTHVSSVCFSPDGKLLASAGGYYDGNYHNSAVKVWDAQTGQEAYPLEGHRGWVHSITFSPDGKRLASAGSDRTVKVWDVQTGQESLTFEGHAREVNSVAFSPDGRRLASASNDGTVKVWDAQTGQEAFIFKGHAGSVYSVCFSPDGKSLASAGEFWEKGEHIVEVKLWDAQTGQKAYSLKGHHGSCVHSITFSSDGKRLASASKDGLVMVWDLEKKR